MNILGISAFYHDSAAAVVQDGLLTAAAHKLHHGDWQGFALWFLVGIAFLQVGGSLTEITTSAIIGVVLGKTLSTALQAYQKRLGARAKNYSRARMGSRGTSQVAFQPTFRRRP